jgi:hypothetical protein
MASSNGQALNSKQTHEQLHVDLNCFCEFIQDSDIDMFDPIKPDVGGCSGNYNEEDKITIISTSQHFGAHMVINHLQAEKHLLLQTHFFNVMFQWDVGGWIILGWILERWDGVVWTGFVWLRIGTSGELF